MNETLEYIFGSLDKQRRRMDSLKKRLDVQVAINNRQLRTNSNANSKFLYLGISILCVTLSVSAMRKRIDKLEKELNTLKEQNREE